MFDHVYSKQEANNQAKLSYFSQRNSDDNW